MQSIKASKFVLISLQKLYESSSSLEVIPSTIYLNPQTNLWNPVISYNNFKDDIEIWHLENASRINFHLNHDNHIEKAVFELEVEDVIQTVQLADQLLASLLKKEERVVTCSEFSNLTTKLNSFTQKAANITSQTSNDELNKKKAHIIDRIDFLSYSLTFFQKNLLPDEEYVYASAEMALLHNRPQVKFEICCE